MKTRLAICTVVLIAAAACISARPAADACHLLTKKDLAAVQGEAFASAKLSSRTNTSQCFYQLPTFINSVSVDVVRVGGREFWKEHFEKERPEPRQLEDGTELGKKKVPPQLVRGVGEKAYWAGSTRTGSLYVLYRDSVLRISVGGNASQEEKIEKSKKLAARALRRL